MLRYKLGSRFNLRRRWPLYMYDVVVKKSSPSLSHLLMSCCNFSSTTTWRVVTAREIYCTILHSNCVGHLNTRYDPLKRTSNKQPGGVHLPRCSYPILTVAKTVVTSSGVAGPLAAWCGGQICRPNFLNPVYTIQPVVKPA